jgi:hypothetical protein
VSWNSPVNQVFMKDTIAKKNRMRAPARENSAHV